MVWFPKNRIRQIKETLKKAKKSKNGEDEKDYNVDRAHVCEFGLYYLNDYFLYLFDVHEGFFPYVTSIWIKNFSAVLKTENIMIQHCYLGNFRHVLNQKLDLSMRAVCRASKDFFPPKKRYFN